MKVICPSLSKGDCQRESKSQPLTFVTSVSAPSTVTSNVSSATVNESLAAIMSSMERISASHDLPHVRVQKFDGSPQQYPSFRQRFEQLVEAKPLDDAVKMTRLLQFLERPALLAVQRYETLPGGLAKALKTLKDRFGQPFQVVRASVESLTKGPVIQPNDKDSLQQYADMAQVTYDTLESMGYLNEMNADNLEKVIKRLPKWMQAKFAERLKRLESEGHVMPTFKDVVDFLKERAFIMNHPFFSAERCENVVTRVKSRGKLPVTPKSPFFVQQRVRLVQCVISPTVCTSVRHSNPNLLRKEMTLLSNIRYVLTVLVHLYTTQENASRQSGVKWKAVVKHITRCYIFMNQRKKLTREL